MMAAARKTLLIRALFLLGFWASMPSVNMAASACSVCAVPQVAAQHNWVRERLGQYHSSSELAAMIKQSSLRMGTLSIRKYQHQLLKARPIILVAAVLVLRRRMLSASKEGDTSATTEGGDSTEGDAGKEQAEKGKKDKPVTGAMVAAIGVYKNVISPLLPPACRFVPTCSQYGVQAIEEFGPTKGCALIAWRLLRCSPVGGKGYDPPKWPPVPYTYSSY